MADNNRRDLLVVCLWAIVAPLTMIAPDPVPRLLATLPWLLVLPGYAALRAIGLRMRSLLELGVFTVGLSLALSILGGFLLNGAGALTPVGWAVWLTAATLALSGIAAIRNQPPWWADGGLPRPSGLGRRQYGIWAAAALAVGAAFLLAVHDDLGQGAFQRTDFWILPEDTALPARVTLGIHNAETEAQEFEVDMMSGGRLVAAWRSLRLEPGETTTWTAPLPPDAGSRRVEAWLFKAGNRGRIHRKVWLALDG